MVKHQYVKWLPIVKHEDYALSPHRHSYEVSLSSRTLPAANTHALPSRGPWRLICVVARSCAGENIGERSDDGLCRHDEEG